MTEAPMERPKIGDKVKFWEEQDRINRELIPRVLKQHELLTAHVEHHPHADLEARAQIRALEESTAAAIRVEMTEGLASIRSDLAQGQASIRDEMTEGFAAIRAEMNSRFNAALVLMATLWATLAGGLMAIFFKG